MSTISCSVISFLIDLISILQKMCDVPSSLPINYFDSNLKILESDDNQEITSCWLDCDPGHDDAMAIILACYNKKVDLIGISTTAGNQGVEKTTKNALNALNIIGLISSNSIITEMNNDCKEYKLNEALEYGGLKVPVIKGCSKPLLRPTLLCGEIHGESGLEGAHLPPIPQNAQDFTEKLSEQIKHFTTLIYEHIKASKTPITIVITGPMTNIALLLLNYPDVTKYISKIVFMGN